ncbi:hypothetical protein JCM10908_000841 [Rhodotorula pacifica]|uniref:uncharacterized protein n=1 Tax=Rhodotorula pacifica TaxID=1495444 RepID=UPI003171B972
MARLIGILAHLPAVRRGFLTVLFLAGLGDMVAAIVLLAYQLTMTSGYQRIVPSIVITSFLCTAFPLWFLYSKPYSIRLPGSGSTEARVGGMRDKIAKFSRSIAAELMALAGTGVWVLISVSNLHAETPGLINHCGGWPICRMLLAVLALTCFLFLALPFALLLCSTLYFTIRRHSPLPIFVTSFLAVDWERYSGRPVNRAATVKRTKKGKAVSSPSPRVLEGAGAGAGAGTESMNGRPDSQAPVFAFQPGRYGGGGGVAGGDSMSDAHHSGLDWDVRSGFTVDSNGERPASMFTAGTGAAAGSPTPEHSVFVLMEEEEKAMEAEAEATSPAGTAAEKGEEGNEAAATAKEVGAAL